MFLYDYLCLKYPTVNSHPKKYLIHILTLHYIFLVRIQLKFIEQAILWLPQGPQWLGLRDESYETLRSEPSRLVKTAFPESFNFKIKTQASERTKTLILGTFYH